MRKTNRLGFSLIELSIVILVIGILVVGITKGSRIINSSRLASAQSLTKASPVNSNNNVVLWLETTSEASFSAEEAADQSTVTNWFDIKGSAITDPFNVTQTDVSKKPHYITNSTNGLPTLRFDGGDTLEKTNVAGSTLSKAGNQVTIFVVQKYYTPAHKSSAIFWQSSTNINRINLHSVWQDGKIQFDFGGITTGRIQFQTSLSTFANRTNIITAFRRPNDTGGIRINGIEYISSSTFANILDTSPIKTFYVASMGSSNYQNSDINEIIIFRTALKDSEIQEIEQYLSVKWGVALKGL